MRYINKEALILSTMHLFNDGYLASMPLLLPFIEESISLSLSLVGFLGSLLSFSGIVLALPAGMIATRLGSIRVLCFAVLGYALGFVAIAISNSSLFIVIGFILGSISFGIFHPIAFSSIAKVSKEGLGKNMGTFAATGDIGKIALSTLIPILIALSSWRVTSLLYSVIAFVFFFVTLLFSREIKVSTSSTTRKSIDLSPMKNKKFLVANTASFLDSFANASLFIFLPFLLSYRGIDTIVIGTFTGIFFVGNLLGKVIMGRVVDKVGQEMVFIICEILIAITMIALVLSVSFALILILAFILGFFTKGTIPITSAMIGESVKASDNYESAFSLSSFTTSIANTIAPLFFGFIADCLGVLSIFFLCSFVALLSVIPVVIQVINERKEISCK